jgi:hypothetical protein
MVVLVLTLPLAAASWIIVERRLLALKGAGRDDRRTTGHRRGSPRPAAEPVTAPR